MNKSKFQIFTENLYFTLFSMLKIIILSRRNKFPKNKFDTKECVILGNGPSLKKTIETHASFLNKKELICVNHFAEAELYGKLKPSIYVLNAPEMWKDDVEKFYDRKGEKLFTAIKENTKWKIQLFIPRDAEKYNKRIRLLEQNPNISINFFNPTGIEGFDSFLFYAFSNGAGMPRPHNVLLPSLMLAVRYKFLNVYIAGADHDWIKEIYVSDENRVYITQKHFYDEKSAKPETMDNLGKGERKLHEILEKFVIALKGYFVIERFAKKNQVNIYNITPNSYIDAFKKKIF